MQNSPNITKVIDFKLNKKEKAVNFQILKVRNNLFLIQIQSLTVRRFAYDAIAAILSGHSFTKEELLIKDYLYIQNHVNEYVATMNILAFDGSMERKTYGRERMSCSDPVFHDQEHAQTVFNALMEKREPGQWKSALQWTDEDFKTKNTSGFVYIPDNLYPPLLYVEIEKAAPYLIPDILDYKGQAILICENIGNIVTCMSAFLKKDSI
jgi:hypothetical protein